MTLTHFVLRAGIGALRLAGAAGVLTPYKYKILFLIPNTKYLVPTFINYSQFTIHEIHEAKRSGTIHHSLSYP